ncbi:MAG: polyprenyl synthetase family protein [Magnetococcales bacterium]|nr:polyprenyl synthetase family protein [Magnetococcales bacterium]MBF0116376.1 polyprenyl synthetase family protein [Magnetococcales bacterium]
MAQASPAEEQERLRAYLTQRRAWVESALATLPRWQQAPADRLTEAMRYSLLAGGKRLRPVLVLACAEALGAEAERFLPFACALECIHTYSLIHDDLPAMDDDALRRGRPTCHMQFDEATAILAGDALLTLAFELAAEPMPGVAAALAVQMVLLLARAAGMEGMVGGQMLDMRAENREISLSQLQKLHACKTGALIQVSCVAGATLAGADAQMQSRFAAYGAAIGLAFQITDDILDETGDSHLMGKTIGKDRESVKATYPRLMGLEEAGRAAAAQIERAEEALQGLSEAADPLRWLARYILTRRQ